MTTAESAVLSGDPTVATERKTVSVGAHWKVGWVMRSLAPIWRPIITPVTLSSFEFASAALSFAAARAESIAAVSSGERSVLPWQAAVSTAAPSSNREITFMRGLLAELRSGNRTPPQGDRTRWLAPGAGGGDPAHARPAAASAATAAARSILVKASIPRGATHGLDPRAPEWQRRGPPRRRWNDAWRGWNGHRHLRHSPGAQPHLQARSLPTGRRGRCRARRRDGRRSSGGDHARGGAAQILRLLRARRRPGHLGPDPAPLWGAVPAGQAGAVPRRDPVGLRVR